MTDKKLTDAEVKKALEEYINFADLEYTNHTSIEVDILKNALDLINRQEVRIHQQEKTIMEIQNANLIDFKATIGNYMAENESLIAEIERLWLCIDELKKLVGKHEPNYDPSEEVDTLVQRITTLDAPSLQAKIKAEAYKEFAERLREKTKWLFSSVSINNEIDNLLNELVGNGDGKRKD